MIGISQVRKAISQPHLGMRELNKRYHYNRHGAEYNADGDDFMAEDWDTLIILDACRHDLFEETCSLQGNLEVRESRGADTVEFLRGNFTARQFHDTVYVTATPMLHRHKDDIGVEFHDVVNVWDSDGWDEELGTVPPEPVTSAALDAHETYPQKRILIHYLQPHYPFVGSDSNPFAGSASGLDDRMAAWTKAPLQKGRYSRDDVWTAYRENLEYVLEHVEELVECVDGKIVVTSDHGNLVGERGWPIPISEWGHPRGLHVSDLLNVPWLELPYESRREIRSEPPASHGTIDADEEVVNERLMNLGYVDP